MDQMAPFVFPPDPKGLRKAQPYDEPLSGTIKWVARLPAQVRPLELLKQFPRIANVLARAWSDAAEFQRQMEELLVDRRGNRSGFPVEVYDELLALRDYYLGRYPHLPFPPPGVAPY
jgi:hypothetical protein